MWVKLGNDYLNLDHVIRVKFNRTWKNGLEDTVAEVEALIKGEMQIFTRYRGAEAATLQAALQAQPKQDAVLVGPAGASTVEGPLPVSHSMANTMHDFKIP